MSNRKTVTVEMPKAPPGCAAAACSAVKLSRQEISEAIERESLEVPFTMPFFLSGELLKECRRQGLKTLKDTGPDYKVTVKIVTHRPRIKCPDCGKNVALAPKAGVRSHRNRQGEWCGYSHPQNVCMSEGAAK